MVNGPVNGVFGFTDSTDPEFENPIYGYVPPIGSVVDFDFKFLENSSATFL
jgi:hypothetical protein